MVRSILLGVACWSMTSAQAALPRDTPESQGVSSPSVRAFVESIDRRATMHSFMLVRHGRVVAEGWWSPESADKPHALWSLSKSFTSIGVGLAIAEGRLSLDDPVLKFFPDDAPPDPSANLRAMRIRHLLTMTCGHEAQPTFTPEVNWVRTFLAHPVPHEPGTCFRYNSPGTHMLSAIVGKATGQTLLDYLKPRLFEPLGIVDPTWETSPQGNTVGGAGLSLRTEDIATFGQLLLQRGRWGDRQLVPAEWIEAATRSQVPNDDAPSAGTPEWRQGYGYQFWRCRHDAFRGDGKNGQFCIVLPKLDAVIAMTADEPDMQAMLDEVWERLLPSFHNGPLPADAAGEAELKRVLTTRVARVRPATTEATRR